jgi:hypothetical protein
MDEQKQAQVFNALLDSILAGNDLPLDSSELSETVKLASYLHGFDLAANTFALQHDLRERLTTQNKEKILMKRNKLLIGVTVLVMIGLFVMTPAGTYAQSILRRIGWITLTTQEPYPKYEQEAAATVMTERVASATALAEQTADNENVPVGEVISPDSTPESTSNSNGTAVTIEDTTYPTATPPPILTDEEIQNLAGFPGWRPKFVPEGYTLSRYNVEKDNAGNPFVHTGYSQGGEKETFMFFDTFQSVTDAKRPEDFGSWNIGDATVSNVLVNGKVAVFAEKAQIIPPPGANILIWTTNEYTFTMIASDLSQPTMIAIAESLQAP